MRSTECSLVLAFSSLRLRVRYVSQIAGRYVHLVHKPTRDSVTRDKQPTVRTIAVLHLLAKSAYS